MLGRKRWLVLIVGIVLVASMGCQSGKKVAKADFDALNEQNKRLVQQNADLQSEFEQMRTAAPAPSPAFESAPATTTVPGRAPASDIDAIRRQLPAGATVEMRHNQPVIRIEGALVNFGPGRAGVSEQGKRVLDRVATILNSNFAGSMVQVEGHTDSDPIRRTKNLYKNNWELGMKRATEVVDYLVSRGVDPKRLQATSFGEHQPISTDKSKNRRVEIVVSPSDQAYAIP